MSARWFVVRRTLWALFTTYLILSVAFAAIALPADPNEALAQFAAASGGQDQQAAADAYEAARGRDRPLADRYVGWLVDVSTFDWGESDSMGQPVAAVVFARLRITLLYLLPALLFATVGGVALGWVAARRRNESSASVLTVVAYLGLSVPNFLLAQGVVLYSTEFLGVSFLASPAAVPVASEHVVPLVLSAAALTVTMLASQMRFARAEVLEFVTTDFVKVARAKGVGWLGVARHVMRNAAVPLLTFFVTDMIGVLILAIYVVEAVFNVPGIGNLTFTAVGERDVPLVLSTTLLVVVFVILANLLEDVAYAVLDPRLDLE